MNRLKQFAVREPSAVVTLIVLAVVVVAWAFTTSHVSWGSVAIVVSQVLPLAMAATAMAVVILGKGIDLSVGASLALANVLIAKLSGDGVPVLFACLVAILVCLIIGAINGSLIAYLGLPPLVVTLAMSSVSAGVALYILPQPGGSVPQWFSNISIILVGPVPLSVLLLVGVPLALWYPFRRLPIGTATLAVGADELAAYNSGIDVRRTRAITYVIAGLFSCLGGIFVTMTSMSGDPKIGVPFTMNAIASAVLGGCLLSGGRGTITGTVAGAAILQLLGNLLFSIGVNGYWQYVVIGVLLICALALPPLLRQIRRPPVVLKGATH